MRTFEGKTLMSNQTVRRVGSSAYRLDHKNHILGKCMQIAQTGERYLCFIKKWQLRDTIYFSSQGLKMKINVYVSERRKSERKTQKQQKLYWFWLAPVKLSATPQEADFCCSPLHLGQSGVWIFDPCIVVVDEPPQLSPSNDVDKPHDYSRYVSLLSRLSPSEIIWRGFQRQLPSSV